MCTVSKQEHHQHTGPKKKQEQQNRLLLFRPHDKQHNTELPAPGFRQRKQGVLYHHLIDLCAVLFIGAYAQKHFEASGMLTGRK